MTPNTRFASVESLMPTGYLLIFSWTIVALGGALFLGTGAALVRYVRTGRFPGESMDAPAEGVPGLLRRVVLRCVLGLTVAAVGLAGVLSVGG